MAAVVLHEPAKAVGELHGIRKEDIGTLTGRHDDLRRVHLGEVPGGDQALAVEDAVIELQGYPLGHVSHAGFD